MASLRDLLENYGVEPLAHAGELMGGPEFNRANFDAGIDQLSQAYDKGGLGALLSQYGSGLKGTAEDDPLFVASSVIPLLGPVARGAGAVAAPVLARAGQLARLMAGEGFQAIPTIARGATRLGKVALENPLTTTLALSGANRAGERLASAQQIPMSQDRLMAGLKAAAEAASMPQVEDAPSHVSPGGVSRPLDRKDLDQVRSILELDQDPRGKGQGLTLTMRGDQIVDPEQNSRPGFSRAASGTQAAAAKRYGNLSAALHPVDPRIRIAEMQLAGKLQEEKGKRSDDANKVLSGHFNRLVQLRNSDPDIIARELKKPANQVTASDIYELAQKYTARDLGAEQPSDTKTPDKPADDKRTQDLKAENQGGVDGMKLLIAGILGTAAYKYGGKEAAGRLLSKLGLMKPGLAAAAEAAGPAAASAFSAESGEVAPATKAFMDRLRGTGNLPAIRPPGQNFTIGPITGTSEVTDDAAQLIRDAIRKRNTPRLGYSPEPTERGFIMPKDTNVNIADEFVEPTRAAIRAEQAASLKPGGEDYLQLNRAKTIARERAQLPATVDEDLKLSRDLAAQESDSLNQWRKMRASQLKAEIEAIQNKIGVGKRGLSEQDASERIRQIKQLMQDIKGNRRVR